MQKLRVLVIDHSGEPFRERFKKVNELTQKYAGVEIEFELIRKDFTTIKFGEAVKKDNGLWYYVDREWFENYTHGLYSPETLDVVCATWSQRQWLKAQPGNRLGGESMEDPQGVSQIVMQFQHYKMRKINNEITVDEWVARFIHELSHSVFDHIMEAPHLDTTHFWDYEENNLVGALTEWRIGRVNSYRYQLLQKLREALIKLAALLRQQQQTRDLEDLARAIKKNEGYGTEGAITITRNNNPGALRWSPFQDGNVGGFARFDNYEKGWKALLHQLRIVAEGKSPAYSTRAKIDYGLRDSSQLTLKQFFSVYAPSEDSNDPVRYAQNVARWLGIPVETRMSTFA